jgi:hypothetical protein
MSIPLRLLVLSVFCLSAHAATPYNPYLMKQPFFELIEREVIDPIELSDIDVAVLTPADQCDPKMKKSFFGTAPASNQQLVQSWICMSFVASAADPEQKVAIHPITIDAYPTEPSSVAATVAELAERAGTRRYVALVDWRVDGFVTPVNCGFFCTYRLDTPMEIAVFDRQSGKTVWHVRHVNQGGYSGSKYDQKEAFYAGAGNIQNALRQLVSSEKARRNLADAGITSAIALQPGALALDPATNLIFINDNRSSPRHETYVHEIPSTFTLKKQEESDDKAALFLPTYHGYLAFKLAPGKYTLKAGSNERLIDIRADSKPLYLGQSKNLFGSGSSIDELDAAKLLNMFGDAANWALPEATPASVSKNRPLRWALSSAR